VGLDKLRDRVGHSMSVLQKRRAALGHTAENREQS
jgi:hypothetical protein